MNLEPLESRVLLVGNPLIQTVDPLPADGGSVSAAIDRLTVQVNEDLNATTVNNLSHWSLVGAGGDNAFGTPDDVTHTLTLPTAYSSGTSITLDIRRSRRSAARRDLPVYGHRGTDRSRWRSAGRRRGRHGR